MKIVKLTAQNVMGLKAVEITPTGHEVEIAGDNGAGKSAVLNCIAFAFAGKRGLPKEPLRRGAKSGELSVTLDGDVPKGKPPLTITLKLAEKGRITLTITDVEGNRLPTPQAVLDSLWNRVAFDPLAFSRQSAKEQLETLKSLVGIDFTELDAERDASFSTRTDINRDAKALKTRLDAMTTHDEAPEEEVSVAALSCELTRRIAVNQDNTRVFLEEQAALRQKLRLHEDVTSLKRRLAEATQLASNHDATVAGLQARVAGLVDEDCDEIQSQISTAEETNRQVRANQAARNLSNEHAGKCGTSEGLTDRIATIDAAKADILTAATFPVEGLSFTDDGVTLNGLPFEQASSGESIRTSVAIGFALNPDLPLVLIREGSLLDGTTRAELRKCAKECDGQAWIELVGAGGENSVVIEDGTVKHSPGPEPATA